MPTNGADAGKFGRYFLVPLGPKKRNLFLSARLQFEYRAQRLRNSRCRLFDYGVNFLGSIDRSHYPNGIYCRRMPA